MAMRVSKMKEAPNISQIKMADCQVYATPKINIALEK